MSTYVVELWATAFYAEDKVWRLDSFILWWKRFNNSFVTAQNEKSLYLLHFCYLDILLQCKEACSHYQNILYLLKI